MAAGQGNFSISQPSTLDSSEMGKRLHLEKIYFGSTTGALRGPKALYERAQKEGYKDITRRDVANFLKTLPVYSKFRPARKKYPRNKIIAQFCGEVYQIDIMDMQNVVHENDGYKYALLGYDTYCKYLSSFAIRDRTPVSVIAGLEHFVSKLPFSLVNIYWDKEGSFLSKAVQSWLKSKEINNYTTTSVVKAPGVERVIRTIRVALARYFTKTGTVRWIDFLPHFVSLYNQRTHSTTKMKPIDVANDPFLIPESAPQSILTKKVPQVGSFVRLNRLRGIFGKEFTGNWTEEIFKVVQVRNVTPIPMIGVQDLTGEPILGMFYPEEVQEIEWNNEKRVDKVIKTRMQNGKKEHLVTFDGWPKTYTEWISS